MNPYATNKALLHVDRLQMLKAGKQPNPVHLQLILSDLCNHNCSFCAYRQSGYTSSQLFKQTRGNVTIKNPNRMIDTIKAVEILGDAARMGVKAIQVTGGGEPTLHPHCSEIMAVAHALGLETSLVTNGTKLDKALRNTLMKSKWIRVSIDAATKETYNQIRGLGNSDDFDLVKANIRELTEERNKANSSLYIGMSFVVTRENWKEIVRAIDLANELGVDNLRFASKFSNEDDKYYENWGDEAELRCDYAAGLSTDKLLVTDSLSERRSDLRLGHPDYERCLYQHITTFIGADLNLYACCVISYNQRGLIGSLKEQSFFELWHCRQKWEFMDNFDARECPRCQFNSRNRKMQALLDGLPDLHGNFI